MLIRLKSDIPLKRISPVLADGSYLAELSGDGVTVAVRVIEYYADVEGQDVPEMFCLVTDLMDITEYPGAAARRGCTGGGGTGRRPRCARPRRRLDGAGPGTGPMLRSGSPALVRQELAAWAAATEMTRGVARDAALAAAPARKGRRAGQPVRPREISCARARRAILAAIRAGNSQLQALTREIAKYRTVVDRNRHRARKSKSPSSLRPRQPRRTPSPASPRPSSPWPTAPPDDNPGQQKLPSVTQPRKTDTSAQMPKAVLSASATARSAHRKSFIIPGPDRSGADPGGTGATLCRTSG